MNFIFLFLFSFLNLSYASPNTVVATVGNQKITLEEFEKRYAEVKTLADAPSKEVFLEDLVRYRLGVLEAEKRNLRNDPVIAERLRQELYKGFVEKELGKKVDAISVTEAEMRAYYKKNPEVRISHILISFKPNPTPQEKAAAQKRAQEIYAEVKASKKSFEELVQLYTDDASTKPTGGDIGWQSRMTITPAFYNAVEKLKPGQITDIVESEFGFHIIKLTERNSYKNANKRQVRAAVFEQKRKQLFNSLFDQLKKKHKIQINKTALK